MPKEDKVSSRLVINNAFYSFYNHEIIRIQIRPLHI